MFTGFAGSRTRRSSKSLEMRDIAWGAGAHVRSVNSRSNTLLTSTSHDLHTTEQLAKSETERNVNQWHCKAQSIPERSARISARSLTLTSTGIHILRRGGAYSLVFGTDASMVLSCEIKVAVDCSAEGSTRVPREGSQELGEPIPRRGQRRLQSGQLASFGLCFVSAVGRLDHHPLFGNGRRLHHPTRPAWFWSGRRA